MDLSPHWKAIIDTLKEGLLIISPDGTILAVNPAAELLTGYSADELIGRSCRILDCTGCVIFGQGSGERWCNLFQDGMVKAKKCLITNKEHHAVTILKNATVLRDADGRVIGAVETLTDISEVVRQQEEILALRKTICPPPPEAPPARERDELIRVLREVAGNQSAAARMLGVSRVTVWKRMKKHRIDLTRDLN